jgi:RNA methyltransferase, TrmH family
MSLITSPDNARVKLARGLQRQAKIRRRERRLVLEGVRLLLDAVAAGAEPDYVLYPGGEAALGDVIAPLADAGIACLPVTAALMRDLAETETPQGVLGVFPWPDLAPPPNPALIVVADGWRDPGNLGTLLRTAAAAGVDAVALVPGTVDPFNPKVLRAGMGAHFRLPLLALDWPELVARFSDMAVILADARGEVPYTAVDWTRPSLLVIGGEAHGFSRTAGQTPHTLVRIPMVAGTESLNAAVAAAILVYEARRHALLPGP